MERLKKQLSAFEYKLKQIQHEIKIKKKKGLQYTNLAIRRESYRDKIKTAREAIKNRKKSNIVVGIKPHKNILIDNNCLLYD